MFKNKTKNKKLLIYSQDGLGLGHQRRTSRIADQLLLKSSDFSVVTICDSPLGQVFPGFSRQTYFRIPTLIKTGNGIWESPNNVCLRRVKSRRQKKMKELLKEFRPDIFLVDHMPQGALGELIPIVENVRQTGCRLILGLRDILDNPAIVIERWRKENAYAVLQELYDHILIYGQEDIFNTRSAYRLPSHVASTFCGYVSPSQRDASPKAVNKIAHQKKGRSNTKRIFVSFGGGADAAELLRDVVVALQYVSRQHLIHTTVTVGPFNPLQFEKETISQKVKINIVRSTKNMLSKMLDADLLISMGGYNTISEVLFTQKPALVIPRKGPSLEQSMRAHCLNQRGILDYISYDSLTPEKLSEKICSLLACPKMNNNHQLNLRGASLAASILSRM